MIRLPLCAAAAMLLVAGCGSTGAIPRTEVRTVRVEVPVPVSCVPADLSPSPVYQVTKAALLLAPDAAARLLLAVAGFLERDARLTETEPVLDGCRG
jgi:hypothetical protein